MIVLDASAVVEWLLRTPKARAVEGALDSAMAWHAPHLLDVEVAQVLRRLVAQRMLPPARAHEALDDLGDLPLTRHAHDWLIPRVWELRANITAYDALYIALAEVLDARLITCDRRLKKAPGHHAHVEVV